MNIKKIGHNRWRAIEGTRILGFIEKHEFATYEDGKRVATSFWIGRFPDNGWKEQKPKKCKTKAEAIAFLKGKGSVKYNERRMRYAR